MQVTGGYNGYGSYWAQQSRTKTNDHSTPMNERVNSGSTRNRTPETSSNPQTSPESVPQKHGGYSHRVEDSFNGNMDMLRNMRSSRNTEIDIMRTHAQAAQPVSEEVAEETAQPKPGANSQAIADAVSENMYMLWDNCTKQPPQPPKQIFANFIYTGRPVPAQAADGFKNLSSEFHLPNDRLLTSREAMASSLMTDITEVLSKSGITLARGEKFNISVDKYCKVTVTGDNAEKAKAIEDVLNSPAEGKNWGLLLQKKYMEDDMLKNDPYAIFNPTKEHLNKVNKMLLENYIANASGGTVSLDDLHLSADGKIMGLPPELDKLINSIEPAYCGKTRQEWEKQISEEYDSYKKREGSFLHSIYDIPKADEALNAYRKGNKNEYVQIIVDGLMEKTQFADVKTALTEVLRKGVNNIPDANVSYVLGSGGIMFA